MAREIIIYEQAPTEVSCIFVYETSFVRLGEKFPLSPPVEDLPVDHQVLFNLAEKVKILEGELAYEFSGTIRFRVGTTTPQRNNRLRNKYRERRRQFRQREELPKVAAVEYVTVP